MAQGPTTRASSGCHGLVALLLVALLLSSLLLARAEDAISWSLYDLANSACQKIHSSCDCVDPYINSGGKAGQSSCLYNSLKVNGFGVQMLNPTFNVPNLANAPKSLYVLRETCNRYESGPAICMPDLPFNMSNFKPFRYFAAVNITIGLGMDLTLYFHFPCKYDLPRQVVFPIQIGYPQQFTVQGDSLAEMPMCVNHIRNQAPGTTCGYYSEPFIHTDLDMLPFTYEVSLRGGVRMDFKEAVDVPKNMGKPPGGRHFIWWLSIADVIRYSKAQKIYQSELFELPNDSKHVGNPVIFHGRGFIDNGYFLDVPQRCNANVTDCS